MATRKTPAASKTPRASTRAAKPRTEKAGDPWKVIQSSASKPKARVAALGDLAWSIAEDRSQYRAVLAIATNSDEPSDVRNAALSAAQSVSFNAQRFPSLRPDYLRALRKLGNDADPEMRQRSLGMLMREGDAATEERLRAGLDDAANAQLPPAKALQLLSYQLHADTYAAARRIVEQLGDAAARSAALRLLAADATATPIFERLVADKTEPIELRRLAVTALHQLAPDKLQQLARAITLDDKDDNDVRTSCLVALAHFGDSKDIEGDAELQAQVDRLSTLDGSGAAPLKDAAKQFRGRYSR